VSGGFVNSELQKPPFRAAALPKLGHAAIVQPGRGDSSSVTKDFNALGAFF
jgi:hypothetical protein